MTPTSPAASLVAILLLLALTAAGPCPATHARYAMRGDRAITARFVAIPRTPDWRSGLALRLDMARSGRRYWFLPWQGGTDGRTNLAWVAERGGTAPRGGRADAELFATDPAYRLAASVPDAARVAPEHMLIPALGHLLWYSTPHDARDDAPRQFLDRVACTPPPAGEAPPPIVLPPVP